jgi:catechol 2,3-dioxygenase-like lactoylglutathione lyase family enzyme
MLIGAHVLLYSKQPEADRVFFRDVLGFPFANAGDGWLIFKLPTAEVGIHPTEPGDNRQLVHGGHGLLGAVLYLMCDDLHGYMKKLAARHVSCTEVETEPWGIHTTIKLPSGGELGLYQPTHQTALNLKP